MLDKMRSVLAECKDALIFEAIIVFAMITASIVENTDLVDWLFIPAVSVLVSLVVIGVAYPWCARRQQDR